MDEIHQYFNHFGEIKSLVASYIDNKRFIFIVFAKSESAQAVFVETAHEINGKSVHVYRNEAFGSIININLSMIPENQDSPTHILNSLPTENLLGLFKYLDIKDLSMVADVCTKFRTIAKDTFAKEFSHLDEYDFDRMDARTLAKVLRNFGTYIKRFELNCEKRVFGDPRRYLQLFFQHVDHPDGALRTLFVKHFNLEHEREFAGPLQSITSRLTTLESKNSSGIHRNFGKRSTGNN